MGKTNFSQLIYWKPSNLEFTPNLSFSYLYFLKFFFLFFLNHFFFNSKTHHTYFNGFKFIKVNFSKFYLGNKKKYDFLQKFSKALPLFSFFYINFFYFLKFNKIFFFIKFFFLKQSYLYQNKFAWVYFSMSITFFNSLLIKKFLIFI